MNNHASQMTSLEKCAQQKGILQSLDPTFKIAAALCFVICVASCTGYHLLIFIPYGLVIVILHAISGIPFGMYMRRLCIALPFALFTGIWGCFFDMTPIWIGQFCLTGGIISFISILARTLLSVGMIMILAGTTTIQHFSAGMRKLRCPVEIVIIFELIGRYLSILMDEVSRIRTAWQLRGGSKRSVALNHFGSLAGGLLIRSFERAERIYHAMQCRGYPAFPHADTMHTSWISWTTCIPFMILCIAIRILA